jgi:hypothetical protein
MLVPVAEPKRHGELVARGLVDLAILIARNDSEPGRRPSNFAFEATAWPCSGAFRIDEWSRELTDMAGFTDLDRRLSRRIETGPGIQLSSDELDLLVASGAYAVFRAAAAEHQRASGQSRAVV